VEEVSCSEGVPAKKGELVSCEASMFSGTTWELQYRATDASGDLSLLEEREVGGASEIGSPVEEAEQALEAKEAELEIEPGV
jgi:hypothetical protein